ncbi:MAG: hypothetical protein ABI548_24850 [Polyangiaceae bacterium]
MAAIAVFYIAVQLSAIAHLALVRHAICLEHGELIHSDAAPAPSRTVAKQSAAPGVRASTGVPPGEEHEHCSVAAHLRHQFLLWDRNYVVDGQAGVLSDVLLADAQSFECAFPLYLLAPKNSPPA